MKIRAYLLILAMLASFPLCAQEEPTEQRPTAAPSTAQWSLGLGVLSSPRPYVGAENNVMAIPIIVLDYKKLYIQGIQAGYHFVNNKNFTFDARAGIVFAGLDPDDSPFLEGMEKRESTIEGGFVFDWKPGKFKLSASAYGAFASPNCPYFGQAGDHIRILETLLRPGSDLPLHVRGDLDPNIASLDIFPGMSTALLRNILKTRDLKGLVLQAFGIGNAPTTPEFLEAIAGAVEDGKVILDITQCRSGEVELGLY